MVNPIYRVLKHIVKNRKSIQRLDSRTFFEENLNEIVNKLAEKHEITYQDRERLKKKDLEFLTDREVRQNKKFNIIVSSNFEEHDKLYDLASEGKINLFYTVETLGPQGYSPLKSSTSMRLEERDYHVATKDIDRILLILTNSAQLYFAGGKRKFFDAISNSYRVDAEQAIKLRDMLKEKASTDEVITYLGDKPKFGVSKTYQMFICKGIRVPYSDNELIHKD